MHPPPCRLESSSWAAPNQRQIPPPPLPRVNHSQCTPRAGFPRGNTCSQAPVLLTDICIDHPGQESSLSVALVNDSAIRTRIHARDTVQTIVLGPCRIVGSVVWQSSGLESVALSQQPICCVLDSRSPCLRGTKSREEYGRNEACHRAFVLTQFNLLAFLTLSLQ